METNSGTFSLHDYIYDGCFLCFSDKFQTEKKPSYFVRHVWLRWSRTGVSKLGMRLELDDPQVEMHLLRSCLGVCRINHLLRSVPKDNILNQLYRFDDALRSSLGRVIHSTIPDTSWQQASLPFRLGGLGVKSAVHSADAAYVASCNATRLSLPAIFWKTRA